MDFILSKFLMDGKEIQYSISSISCKIIYQNFFNLEDGSHCSTLGTLNKTIFIALFFLCVWPLVPRNFSTSGNSEYNIDKQKMTTSCK
jgi:hypothetical protein